MRSSSSSATTTDSTPTTDPSSSTSSANTQPYRIWIDTFCCPIELGGKLLALQRIADVYRQATHVLVLDKALAAFPSVDVHPAELLLRTIGASPWMRRLWTLQGDLLSFLRCFCFCYCSLLPSSVEIPVCGHRLTFWQRARSHRASLSNSRTAPSILSPCCRTCLPLLAPTRGTCASGRTS